MGFYENLFNEMLESDNNVSVTENGAVGYRTTGKNLLDLNFAVASLRGASDHEIVERFQKAFFEDKVLAMRWLFFARDVRGGLGERNLFRKAMEFVTDYQPEMVKALVPLIPEYGRYDDLWDLLYNEHTQKTVVDFIAHQLATDLVDARNNKPISLLAKWLPSINASSKDTRADAKLVCKCLGMQEKQYRKTLSQLRKYLDVVEVKMSAKQWGDINYETVPSKANLLYRNAFLKNDYERRVEYLNALKNGDVKINSSVLYPHEIVHQYRDNDGWYGEIREYDQALESMWDSLPDTVQGGGNTIVVADGSGSMTCNVGNGSTMALDVANAMAIYFAEHSSGEFKDKYITFSSHPQFVNFKNAKSLRDKISIALGHCEVANTNIEAVFDLVLQTAVNHGMKQKDLPANILIISDMEFDRCAYGNDGYITLPLFKVIADRYARYGYKLPRLVFWNVDSRTNTIPVRENDMGVALVSGFSVNICKMVLSGELDPYKCLLETINDKRYDAVAEKVTEFLQN